MFYAFIVSELGDNLVMDVCGKSTSAGTSVIIYKKKHFQRENQLWKEEYVSDSKFFLVPKHAKDKRLSFNVSSIIML